MARPELNRVWARNAAAGDVLEPNGLKKVTGWVAEIPSYQVLNYLYNHVDQFMLSTAQRGAVEWGSDVVYRKGGSAWFANLIYVSKFGNPDTSLSPNLNAAEWELSIVNTTQSILDNQAAEMDNHIANVSNPHHVTAEQVNAYTKGVVDSKINVVSVTINNHILDTNNPHGVTAADVNAVPITGGTYTGTVLLLQDILYIGENVVPATCGITYDAPSSSTALFYNDSWLGVGDQSSVPYYSPDAGVTRFDLLHVDEYNSIRETVNSLFTVPEHDLHMPLSSSTNIFKGVGFSTFTGPAGRAYNRKNSPNPTADLDEPRLEPEGLLLDSTEVLYTTWQGNLPNLVANQSFTISLACVNVELPVATETYLFSANNEVETNTSVYLRIDTSGSMRLKVGSTTLVIPDLEASKDARWTLVVDYDLLIVRLYKDGVDIGGGALAVGAVAGMAKLFVGRSSTTNGSTKAHYSSLKGWFKALTSEQVSSLHAVGGI
jgi:hypothetical protein